MTETAEKPFVVSEAEIGDEVFYRYSYNVFVHGRVTLLSEDLKKIHITGTRMVDENNQPIPKDSRHWFPVEGFIYRYVETTYTVNGETYVAESVSRKASLWHKTS